MARHLYTLVFCILFAAAAVSAQDVTPTPTPTLTPVPTPTPVANPTPVAVLPPVNDSQGVRPEDIKGVPPIAPNYRAENRALPDLGRVGVDMTNQHPMTLRDALSMALENNNDI